MQPNLETALAAYERNLQTLLKDEGKFVLIHETEIVGIFDTYQDALKSGYQRFGVSPFLVKKIQAVEQVQYFTRSISPCPT